MGAYLDHAATSPLRPEAREAMLPWLGGRHGNPSGVHGPARASRTALEDAARPTSYAPSAERAVGRPVEVVR